MTELEFHYPKPLKPPTPEERIANSLERLVTLLEKGGLRAPLVQGGGAKLVICLGGCCK